MMVCVEKQTNGIWNDMKSIVDFSGKTAEQESFAQNVLSGGLHPGRSAQAVRESVAQRNCM